MTNKYGRTRQRNNNLMDELISGTNSASELATVYYYTRRSIRGGSQSTPPGDKAWCIIAPIDIFNGKRKSCNHRCPDSVYFHTLLLIIYLSAVERLICRRELSLIGSTSFGFAQNTTHDFQNTVLNSEWQCLRQVPQKVQIIIQYTYRRRTLLALLKSSTKQGKII